MHPFLHEQRSSDHEDEGDSGSESIMNSLSSHSLLSNYEELAGESDSDDSVIDEMSQEV